MIVQRAQSSPHGLSLNSRPASNYPLLFTADVLYGFSSHPCPICYICHVIPDAESDQL